MTGTMTTFACFVCVLLSIFLAAAQDVVNNKCSFRCERSYSESLLPSLSPSQAQALFNANSLSSQLCWKMGDYVNCMEECAHSPFHEEFVASVRGKCKDSLSELESEKSCLFRHRSFLEIRCSSFLKEALLQRKKTTQTASLSSEVCRLLHLNALCLLDSVASFCPGTKRLTLQDYFFNRVFPKGTVSSTFSDENLASCQESSFDGSLFKATTLSERSKAMKRESVAGPYIYSSKRRSAAHVRKEDVAWRNNAVTPTKFIIRPHSRTPAKGYDDTVDETDEKEESQTEDTPFSASVENELIEKTRRGNGRRIFESQEDLAYAPPNFHYSSYRDINHESSPSTYAESFSPDASFITPVRVGFSSSSYEKADRRGNENDILIWTPSDETSWKEKELQHYNIVHQDVISSFMNLPEAVDTKPDTANDFTTTKDIESPTIISTIQAEVAKEGESGFILPTNAAADDDRLEEKSLHNEAASIGEEDEYNHSQNEEKVVELQYEEDELEKEKDEDKGGEEEEQAEDDVITTNGDKVPQPIEHFSAAADAFSEAKKNEVRSEEAKESLRSPSTETKLNVVEEEDSSFPEEIHVSPQLISLRTSSNEESWRKDESEREMKTANERGRDEERNDGEREEGKERLSSTPLINGVRVVVQPIQPFHAPPDSADFFEYENEADNETPFPEWTERAVASHEDEEIAVHTEFLSEKVIDSEESDSLVSKEEEEGVETKSSTVVIFSGVFFFILLLIFCLLLLFIFRLRRNHSFHPNSSYTRINYA